MGKSLYHFSFSFIFVSITTNAQDFNCTVEGNVNFMFKIRASGCNLDKFGYPLDIFPLMFMDISHTKE